MYGDLSLEISNAKIAFSHIIDQQIPESTTAVTGHSTFVVDWFEENLPLENKEGTALDELNRKVLQEKCYKRPEEMSKQQVPAPVKEDVLVFDDRLGICKEIVSQAPEGRVGTKKIVTQPPSGVTAENIASFVGTKQWDLVIFGYGINDPPSSEVSDVITQQDAVIGAFLKLVDYIFKNPGTVKRLAVLVRDIFSEEEETYSEGGLAVTTHALLFGAANTARLELESTDIHFIDFERNLNKYGNDYTELMPYLMTEVFRIPTFGVNTVRLRHPNSSRKGVKTGRPHGRFVMRQDTSHDYEKANNEFDIPDKGIIGISGGNGALGLVIGEWLLDKAQRQAGVDTSYVPQFEIKFMSRSTEVSKENQARWSNIKETADRLNIKVEQFRLDMSSKQDTEAVIKHLSPNLIGFIHAAGINQDASIIKQTTEKLDAVFNSKHRPALYLHDALEKHQNPNFTFLWLFSSTMVYGNPGQFNYSASNAYLDALARYRRAMGKPCVSMQFGAWGEVGMAASMDEALRRRMQHSGTPPHSVAAGLRGIEGGLRTGLPVFQTFVMEPKVLVGRNIRDDETTTCYLRNFTSEILPPPAPFSNSFETKDAYNIYRMLRYIWSPYKTEDAPPLCFKKFCEPVMRANPDNWETLPI